MGNLIQIIPGYGFSGRGPSILQSSITDPDGSSATTLETCAEAIEDAFEAYRMTATT